MNQSVSHLGRSASLPSDRFRGAPLARDLLIRLFSGFPVSLALRLWTGPAFRVGADPAANDRGFVIVFNRPQAVCAVVLGRDPLRLADLYFRGEVDIEGDFFAALKLKAHLHSIKPRARDKVSAMASAVRLRAMNSGLMPSEPAPSLGRGVSSHSRLDNRLAVQFHYDVSNEFYALWLDHAMVYSCAYFETADTGLEAAQVAKLDHICRKLLLKPNERLLDIGCGWGALVIHAAMHYGVRAHGITLSENQYALARKRVRDAGLEGRVEIELLDYRDLAGEGLYDKIASVGMFEHVGLENLNLYFATVQRLLKPAGLFLNHGITHDEDGERDRLPMEFIHRYVFPDGQLDAVGNIQRLMESARFEIADVEGLRPHYALTLRRWVHRLERNHAGALEYVNEATYRIWRLYMAACALEFENGSLGVYQILAAKRAAINPDMPLTRRHLYCNPVLNMARTRPTVTPHFWSS